MLDIEAKELEAYHFCDILESGTHGTHKCILLCRAKDCQVYWQMKIVPMSHFVCISFAFQTILIILKERNTIY